MKGKTEIILTDVHTGEQKKVLEQNMTTNALNDIFLQEGYMKDASEMYGSNFQPIYQKLLGGILLFDKTLEENAANYFAPAGTNLTACGVYGVKNTTGDTLRGDYNSDESYLDTRAKTMKYVYDFPTSKGNGTIASVCLTSANGGYSSYGAETDGSTGQTAAYFLGTGGSRTFVSISGEYAFAVDYQNDVIYTFTPSTVSSQLQSVTIRKRRAHLKTLPVTYSASAAGEVLESKSVQLSSISSSYVWNYDTTANTLYFMANRGYSEVQNGREFYIAAIPIGTMIARTYNITNRTGVSLNYSTGGVYGGYLYIGGYNNNNQNYKINLESDTDYAQLSGVNTTLDFQRCCFWNHGRIFALCGSIVSWNYRLAAVDPATNKARYTQNYLNDSKGNTKKWVAVTGSNVAFAVMNDGSGFLVPCNYLATINNLSSPVTKTAARTMKVIYTISEG